MRRLLLVAALAALGAAPRTDAAQRFTLEADLALRSNNIFRGSDRGPMGLVAETEATYRLGREVDFTFATSNYARIDGEVGLGEAWYEAGLLYRLPGDMVIESIEAGYRFYNISRRVDRYSFPYENTNGNDTQEWYATMVFDLPGKPTLEYYHDFDRRVGNYLRGSIAHTYLLGESNLWQADLGAWVGLDWARGVDTYRDSGLHLGLLWTPLDNFRIGPTVDLIFPSNQVDPGADGCTPVFGLQMNWAAAP